MSLPEISRVGMDLPAATTRSLLATKYPGAIGAWVAEMALGVSEPIQEALLRETRNGTLGYNDPTSIQLGREAVVRRMADCYGLDVAPEAVGFVSDVVSGFAAVLRHYLPAGEAVVVPTPAYTPFLTTPQQFGYPVVEVPGTYGPSGHHMDLEGIDRALARGARLIVLCNPHNPTGRSFTHEELAALAKVVESHGARVFSDEIHAPLALTSRRHVPYACVSEAAANHSITATSASKAWNIAGLKCAQLIFTSASDAALWNTVADFYVRSVSRLGVAALIAAYEDQSASEWLAKTLLRLRSNNAMVADAVAGSMPGVDYRPAESTYLAWLDCTRLGVDTPAALLRERAAVAMCEGAEFAGPGYVRLNFALPEPVLNQALTAMGRVVREVMRQ
ncbi:aminotransferase class I/II-fold pyridoxal phosphate-dependent enzyme [Streptomyces sp. NPDC048349]|uniref:MalY/PatB family protein n=1 Tax=Streptomyces sp. NPDC048349 TaxID=3155486 RepID=UPI00341200C3